MSAEMNENCAESYRKAIGNVIMIIVTIIINSI